MKTSRNAVCRVWISILTLIIVLSACVPADIGTPIATAVPFPLTDIPRTESVSKWLEIYFTDPSAPGAAAYKGGPDQTLAAALDAARLSVDVAAYSLNLWSVRDALIRAKHRGVEVRMVMESTNMDGQEVQDLINAEIPIVGDQRQGLMHDKFIVIDRAEVWTGSMNFTASGTYNDNNNLIHIRSAEAAADYTTEFNEMFEDNLFGSDVRPATPYPKLTIDGISVEIYFSPDDSVGTHLLELLQGAQESIYFMDYSFTSSDLGDAIIERAGVGITVSGVMDAGQVASNSDTEYNAFLAAGLDVRLDGNTGGLMHHKVIIIDRSIVVTGSYNFTSSAETLNDENVVILFDPDAAAQFLDEFQRVYDQAQQPVDAGLEKFPLYNNRASGLVSER